MELYLKGTDAGSETLRAMKGYAEAVLYSGGSYYILNFYSREFCLNDPLDTKEYKSENVFAVVSNTVVCGGLLNAEMYSAAEYLAGSGSCRFFLPRKLYRPEKKDPGPVSDDYCSPLSGILLRRQLIEYESRLYYAVFTKEPDMSRYTEETRPLFVNDHDDTEKLGQLLDLMERRGALDGFLPRYAASVTEMIRYTPS